MATVNTSNTSNTSNELSTLIANVQALNVLKHEVTPEAYLESACDAVEALLMYGMEGQSVNTNYCIKSQDWYSQVVSVFKEADIEILGSGYFAMAIRFKAIAGKVIKIGFKKEDSGAAYAAYCRNVKDYNISDINFIKRYSKVYMVVMTEYQDYYTVMCDTNVHNNDKAFLRVCYQMTKHIIDYCDDSSIEKFALMSVRYAESFDEVNSLRTIIETRKDCLEALQKQCWAIRDYFKDIAAFDIHEENIMVKWDCNQAHLVITDPVSWTRTGE